MSLTSFVLVYYSRVQINCDYFCIAKADPHTGIMDVSPESWGVMRALGEAKLFCSFQVGPSHSTSLFFQQTAEISI